MLAAIPHSPGALALHRITENPHELLECSEAARQEMVYTPCRVAALDADELPPVQLAFQQQQQQQQDVQQHQRCDEGASDSGSPAAQHDPSCSSSSTATGAGSGKLKLVLPLPSSCSPTDSPCIQAVHATAQQTLPDEEAGSAQRHQSVVSPRFSVARSPFAAEEIQESFPAAPTANQQQPWYRDASA
jgi:hypothetical protein